MHRPVVDGLVRERETINIVSVSKIGKSWLLYSLLLCIVTGRKWLGRLACRIGRVLLIDNELHPPTIARRIKTVAQAIGMQRDEYAEMLEILPVRGLGWNILDIARFLETLDERFALIAIDAKYRAMAAGASENDNAAETRFYNEVDRIAETTGSAVALVHHSTKGAQGEKRVTDVGAGGGSQSRAADTHLILREHEESGVAVLDAAVRSFPPVEPLAVRWEFPLWVPDGTLDVKALKGRQTNGNQGAKDAEADQAVLDACDGWKTRRQIREKTGYGETRAQPCYCTTCASQIPRIKQREQAAQSASGSFQTERLCTLARRTPARRTPARRTPRVPLAGFVPRRDG